MRKARHAVLRRACKCLWLLKRLTRNRQKTATGARHTLSAQLCSVWVGSAFCVMRTSLGTPRAGALHFLRQASRAPLPSETANGRLFFSYPSPFAHASITTSTVERGRPLRSRNGGAALRVAAPLCFFTDSSMARESRAVWRGPSATLRPEAL